MSANHTILISFEPELCPIDNTAFLRYPERIVNQGSGDFKQLLNQSYNIFSSTFFTAMQNGMNSFVVGLRLLETSIWY
mgnify:CR=1 FL=1